MWCVVWWDFSIRPFYCALLFYHCKKEQYTMWLIEWPIGYRPCLVLALRSASAAKLSFSFTVYSVNAITLSSFWVSQYLQICYYTKK